MLDRLSACPSCSEPPAAGDRFCGVCGADLAAAPPAPGEPAGEADFTLAPAAGAVPGPGVQDPPVQEPPVQDPLVQDPSVQGPPVQGPTVGGPSIPGLSVQGPPVPPPLAAPAPVSAQSPAFPTAPASGSASASAPAPDPRAADPRVTLDDAPPDGQQPPHPTGAPGSAGAGGTSAARCVACGTGAVDDDGYCDHCGHKQPLERDHMESELASVAAASDRGMRHHRNEDFFSLHEAVTPAGAPVTIAVVCDGVSSATRPDDASAAAARAAGATMRDAVPQGTPAQQAMHSALLAASDAVTALAAEGPNEPSKNAPACTIVGALTAEGILTVGWIGDSRAYWVPDEDGAPPARLTEDDSWAAQMVAAGLMTEDEAYADARAHAITGWLGADAYEIEPHTASYKPEGAGVVIVCTDGLWNYAESAEQMAAAVPPDGRTRPLHAAQRLVGFALDGGGHDNATVAVIPFPDPSEGSGPV